MVGTTVEINNTGGVTWSSGQHSSKGRGIESRSFSFFLLSIASLLSRKLVLSISMHGACEREEEEESAGVSGMDTRKAKEGSKSQEREKILYEFD